MLQSKCLFLLEKYDAILEETHTNYSKLEIIFIRSEVQKLSDKIQSDESPTKEEIITTEKQFAVYDHFAENIKKRRLPESQTTISRPRAPRPVQTPLETTQALKKYTELYLKFLKDNGFLEKNKPVREQLNQVLNDIVALEENCLQHNKEEEPCSYDSLAKISIYKHYLSSLSGPLLERPTFKAGDGSIGDHVLLISEPDLLGNRKPILTSRTEFAKLTFMLPHAQTNRNIFFEHIEIPIGRITANKNKTHLFRHGTHSFSLNKLWPNTTLETKSKKVLNKAHTQLKKKWKGNGFKKSSKYRNSLTPPRQITFKALMIKGKPEDTDALLRAGPLVCARQINSIENQLNNR